MDTKLKKSKPFGSWLTFFIAISIIFSLFFISVAIVGSSGGNFDALKSPFVDYKDSYAFKSRTSFYFNELFSLVQYNADAEANYSSERLSSTIGREGENLKYFAINKSSNFVATNIPEELLENTANGDLPILPKDYNYIWYFDGQNVSIIKNGEKIDFNRLDSGYSGLVRKFQYYHSTDELENTAVLVAVKDPLVENLYEHSSYYREQQLLPVAGSVIMVLIVITALLLIYTFIKRREKREFDHKLASWLGKIWLEVKIIISFFPLFLGVGFISYASYRYGGYMQLLEGLGNAIFNSIFFLLAFWWFYLILVDLIYNKKQFFTNNSINYLFTRYRKYEDKYPWQKVMLRRAYLLVAIEAVLAFISVWFALVGNLPLAFIIAFMGIYLIYRYLKQYDKTISELGELIDHIEIIKNGDMETKLEIKEDADIYRAAQNLNSIQEGMGIAISEQMKAERMKIDLITNVSHDLKTPLTSIISYVDLLSKEENLPEHIKDYISILSQKSDRLKNLIQDLFDLAKASSENISLNMEKIDLSRLIRQTLADMEEQIDASELALRINLPDEPIYILSDGEKLYRVWENLITNTLKYSLPGSRVFIDLITAEENVVATIKNTANYEMDFNEDEILGRFVRGDEARTSEGSGLGLSIAQSYTEICGGQFSIKIDGDLFKVELKFATMGKE